MYAFLFHSCKYEEREDWLGFGLSSQAPLIIKNPDTTSSKNGGQAKHTLYFCSFKSHLGFCIEININQNSELVELLDNHVDSKEISMAKDSQGLNKQVVNLISRFWNV